MLVDKVWIVIFLLNNLKLMWSIKVKCMMFWWKNRFKKVVMFGLEFC